MAEKEKLTYIVRGIRKTGCFLPIQQLCSEDFYPVAKTDQPKAKRIGDAFVEILSEETDRRKISESSCP